MTEHRATKHYALVAWGNSLVRPAPEPEDFWHAQFVPNAEPLERAWQSLHSLEQLQLGPPFDTADNYKQACNAKKGDANGAATLIARETEPLAKNDPNVSKSA